MRIKSFSCETFCRSTRSEEEVNSNSEVEVKSAVHDCRIIPSIKFASTFSHGWRNIRHSWAKMSNRFGFCQLNDSCTRKNIYFNVSKLQSNKVVFSIAQLNDRCFCFCYFTACFCPYEWRLLKILYLFFSEASQRSVILTPWIWLANSVRSSGPNFPVRTPRTDHSEFSNIAVILEAFCYSKNLHEM